MCATVVLLLGCTEETTVDESIQTDDATADLDVSLEALQLEEGEERIFVMPAPLQVATALTLHNVEFEPGLVLIPSNEIPVAPKYNKAFSMGAYVIDLGYCAVFGHGDEAIDLLDALRTMGNDLGVDGYDEALIQRFENNKENQDSLSYLILMGYEMAHDYIRTNQREELGLVVLAGTWMEGLYLSSHYPELHNDRNYYTFIAQQKYYLENLIILMSRFSDEDVQQIVNRLKRLYGLFDSFVSVADMTIENNLTIPDNFTDKMEEIRIEVTDFRNEFVIQKRPTSDT